MKTSLKCERPGDIEFTITITMKAKEWEELRVQQISEYPSWKLSSAISDVLAQARKIYWAHEPEDDERD